MIATLPSALFLILMTLLSARADELPGDMPLTSAFAESLVSAKLAGVAGSEGYKVTINRPRLPLGNHEARRPRS